MMGRQSPPQEKLFHIGFSVDSRIPSDHPLRRIDGLVDFDFIYGDVKASYGGNGNVSVPPPVILKLLLLLVFYNVRSERELMRTLPMRLDWLWFLGFDLDSEIPNHSVLSKARGKWGVEAFKLFFERIVCQCVEAGLVDGRKLFMDSSFIDADASNNSVVDTQSLKSHLRRGYHELEERLSETGHAPVKGDGPVNQRYVSATDSDTSIIGKGGSKLRYKAHRAVDPASEVITATEVTPGVTDDSHMLAPLLDGHQANTKIKAVTVVADRKYGTADNFLACSDRGVRAHMPDLKKAYENTSSRAGIFSERDFVYDAQSDTYTCPAGNKLGPKSVHAPRRSADYAASKKDCAVCELMSRCTRNKNGRTVKRHFRHEVLERMREAAGSAMSKRDIRTRQHLMERSFAHATRYGFKRSRWRRLWRVAIQEYLTAAIQNIEKLIRYGRNPKKGAAVAAPYTGWRKDTLKQLVMRFMDSLCRSLFKAIRENNPLHCGV